MTASSDIDRENFDIDLVCLHTGEEGPVKAWQTTDRWGYTCVCGREVEHDIRDTFDDGAAQILFILIITGLALLIIGGTAAGSKSLLGGFWLVAAPLAIALFIGANKEDNNS